MYSKRDVTFETCFDDMRNIINFHIYYWRDFFLDSGLDQHMYNDLNSNVLSSYVLEFDNVGVYRNQYILYHKNVYERQKRIEKILSVVRSIVLNCVETLPVSRRIPSCPIFADPTMFSQEMITLERDLLIIRGNSVFPPFVPLNNSDNIISVIDIYYKRLELDEVVCMCNEMETLCMDTGINLGPSYGFCRTFFDFD
jgi:hypothetical protein